MCAPLYRKDVAIPAPAAGVGTWSYRVPAGVRAVLLNVQATIVADANVANRVFLLQVLNAAGQPLLALLGNAAVTAGQTYRLNWSVGPSQSSSAAGYQTAGMAWPYPLNGDDLIQLTVSGIQAGDQLSEIALSMGKGEPWPL